MQPAAQRARRGRPLGRGCGGAEAQNLEDNVLPQGARGRGNARGRVRGLGRAPRRGRGRAPHRGGRRPQGLQENHEEQAHPGGALPGVDDAGEIQEEGNVPALPLAIPPIDIFPDEDIMDNDIIDLVSSEDEAAMNDWLQGERERNERDHRRIAREWAAVLANRPAEQGNSSDSDLEDPCTICYDREIDSGIDGCVSTS